MTETDPHPANGHAIDYTALSQIFLDAHTHNAWQPREVPDQLLRRLVDVLKLAPTSANCSPARIVFVKSQEAKSASRRT